MNYFLKKLIIDVWQGSKYAYDRKTNSFFRKLKLLKILFDIFAKLCYFLTVNFCYSSKKCIPKMYPRPCFLNFKPIMENHVWKLIINPCFLLCFFNSGNFLVVIYFIDFIMVSLLLTLNIFCTLSLWFHCWLLTSECRLSWSPFQQSGSVHHLL